MSLSLHVNGSTTKRKGTLRRRASWDRISMFREEVVQLYRQFEKETMSLCKKYGVEINFWYNPSKIQQPRFIIDGIMLDADDLYDDERFSFVAISLKSKRHRQMKMNSER